MRYLILFLMAGISTACSHAEIVGYDERDHTVSIQANRATSRDKLEEMAQDYCGTPASLVATSMTDVGSQSKIRRQAFGGYTASTTNIKWKVYTFLCKI